MPPPPNRPMSLMQTLVDSTEFSLLKLPIKKVQEMKITEETFADFDHSRPIGISPGYSKAGMLIALSIADDKNCTIVEFNVFTPRGRHDRGGQSGNRSALPRNLTALEQKILCRSTGELFAFDMGPLCLSIYTDAKLHVTNAVDIQSGLSAVDRKPLTAIKEILGTSVAVKEQNIKTVFYHPVYDPDDRKSATDLAQRAWISQLLAVYGNGEVTLGKVPRIDTKKIASMKLDILAKNTNIDLRQNLNKPTRTKHDVLVTTNGMKPASANSMRFSNRLRSDLSVRVITENASGARYTTKGQTGFVKGKMAPLTSDHSLEGKTITSVISIGRDDPTTAEAQRAATVLRVLQGYEQLMDNSPWIQNIFYPADDSDASLPWPLAWSDETSSMTNPVSAPDLPPLNLLPLNLSQQDCVNTMCSSLDEHRITLIQGPPGTGKTSVIASFVQLAVQMGLDGIWLVAQSNVAVKNIAEKLLKTGFFEWRLLVSKDFIFEWHEHLYTSSIQKNIIVSDRFKFVSPNDITGCKVMLCTLSMLSNVYIGKFTSQNPIKILVVDEASQIEINNYVSVLVTSSKLRKMCFIGDDKQLPPYGQEDLQDLQSIFEVPHLRPQALFLDTQYRMPPKIGDIISDLVYDSKLKSNPMHPVTNTTISCHFIDIPGHEERDDASFKNILECEAVIKLAQKLEDQQKLYQIITPYEGQRSTIEGKMKQTPGLNWKNKCFNVDSFQGNEEDYIIVSLVRSRGLGFLDNKRRTNVMLTRCKKGMFIVSSHTFLSGCGANSLVGELAERMGAEAWLEEKDLEEGKF